MRIRALIAAALIYALGVPVSAAEPGPAPVAAQASNGLMARFGLVGLFSRFGETLAASPRQQGVADQRFLSVWEESAISAFSSPALEEQLSDAIGVAIPNTQVAPLTDFLDSELGQRVSRLETETQAVAPDRQIALIAKGQITYLTASDRRRTQVLQLVELTGAELTFELVGQSIRGMAMGLRLAAAGDLEVPWDAVELEVGTQLAGMKASLTDAALGVVAHTYGSLTEDELEAYLEFLRSPQTRRFYAVATITIGEIVRETMFALGETVAQKLHRVSI